MSRGCCWVLAVAALSACGGRSVRTDDSAGGAANVGADGGRGGGGNAPYTNFSCKAYCGDLYSCAGDFETCYGQCEAVRVVSEAAGCLDAYGDFMSCVVNESDLCAGDTQGCTRET
ncbi:MAG TPA: hypothetical protein VGK73_00075, partial [Polyangiaceae bacterium]